jgi:hypothetical protein
MVSVQLNLQIGTAPAVAGSARLVTGESTIGFFTSFDEPLLTAEGLGISLVLLAPTIAQIIQRRLINRKTPPRKA